MNELMYCPQCSYPVQQQRSGNITKRNEMIFLVKCVHCDYECYEHWKFSHREKIE